MPTIKDVAKQANVSVGTVSKFINGIKIKKSNQEKIEQAIELLNFTSNPIARGLRTSKTYTVGVLIPRITDIFCTQVIEGIEEVLNPMNYGIVVCSANDNIVQQTEKLTYLKNKMVDGLIVMLVSSTELNHSVIMDKDIPVVLIDRLVKGLSLDAVVCDNVNGSYSAVEMMINKGHRKIGIIAGPKDIYTAQERLNGYIRAMDDYNIEVIDDYIAYAPYTRDGGREAINKLLDLKERPTAIFTTNYPTTVNSMKVLMERRLVIGEDISLCGYDQTELFEMFNPPLSVVVQPTREMGIEAGKMLLQRMNGEYDGSPQIKRLKTQLLTSESIKTIG